MNQAVSQKLVIGRDLIFTFGPYASVYTRVHHPDLAVQALLSNLYLGLSFALLAYAVFSRTTRASRYIFLLALPTWIHLRDALLFLYPVLAGIHAFQTARQRDHDVPTWLQRAPGLVFVFAPLGLYPLTKGSTLILCLASALVSFGLLASSRRILAALLALVVPALSCCLFWTLAGQPITALLDYFVSMSPIISGYTDAMSLQGNTSEPVAYVLTSIFIVAALVRAGMHRSATGILVSLLFCVTLFLAFKAGFVRHDIHANIAATMLFFVALFVLATVPSRSSVMALLAAFVASAFIVNQRDPVTPFSPLKKAARLYVDAARGMRLRLTEGLTLPNTYARIIEEIQDKGRLPKLEGSADIYSHDQSYLFSSGNQWNPRPIFQSYSVYTRELARINRKHLESPQGPENVFFQTQAIDLRPNPTEDGHSWEALINRYEQQGMANGFLVLKKAPPESAPRIIRHGTKKASYRLGEEIAIDNSHDITFISVDVPKTLAGRVWSLLFKPTELQIRTTLHTGEIRNQRFIVGMAQADFPISPAVETTKEFSALMGNPRLLESRKVKSIAITAPSGSLIWKDQVNVEMTTATHRGPHGRGFHDTAAPALESGLGTSSTAQHCEGSVDAVKVQPPDTGSTPQERLLNVRGWLAASIAPARVADRIYLILSERKQGGEQRFFEATQSSRNDVAVHFGQPGLERSGFEIRVNLGSLQGELTMQIAYREGNKLITCKQFERTIVAH
ncbi:MAG: hypothetical protein Q4D19_04930 [Lautropia sp.]|nr:hypothetical protein [Lautropia sp.]